MKFYQVKYYDGDDTPYWAAEALFLTYKGGEKFIEKNLYDCIIPVVVELNI